MLLKLNRIERSINKGLNRIIVLILVDVLFEKLPFTVFTINMNIIVGFMIDKTIDS